MAEAKPEGMSDQDWGNFQSRYRPQSPDPNAAPAPGAAPGSQAGLPGQVAPGLKNPSPAAATPLQPSPAPQVGLGNTVDAPQGGPQRTTAPGLMANDPGVMYQSTPGSQPNQQMRDGQQPAPQQTPQQQMQAQLRTSIMGMLAPQGAPTTQDADIAPQSQAFAAAAERQQAARRAETVHAANRGGYGDSGGLDQRLDALSQQTGQAIGANDANLIGQKLETRRQQLNTALQIAQQSGLAEESNNLQRQLANLGAQIETRGQDITREQTGLQRDLGNLDASTRIYLGDMNAQLQREGYSTQERLARMETEARKYGIDVQGRLGELDTALRSQLGNRQIDLGYDQLGVDVGRTQAQLDRDAVMAGLGG